LNLELSWERPEKGEKEMSKLSIWPIRIGVIPGWDKSNFTHGMNQGVKIDGASIVYVIKGADQNIIVDSGMGTPEWVEKYHHYRMIHYQPLSQGLKRIGLHPDNIDIVICTHLHWDHCFNNDLFKNARIIVQEDEIRYAIAPLPMHALFYESQLIKMRPAWLKAIETIEIVKGDTEVCPGVDIVKIPGHTPGFQGVNVKTAKGKYFIASDLCPLFDNWEGSPPLKHVVSPIHVNLVDYYDSFKKVEEIANYILPGHDIKVFKKKCYP
jgi:glyoxylase-like metal-dependent hydrolase (beta-lactamase superfamily II)